jgi:phosphatidylglycerophosphate synthase
MRVPDYRALLSRMVMIKPINGQHQLRTGNTKRAVMRSEPETKPLAQNLAQNPARVPAANLAGKLDSGLKREALIQAGAGLGATMLLSWLAQIWLAFPPLAILIAASVYLVFICLIFLWLPEHLPHLRLGTANRITIFRAALVANLAAASLTPAIFMSHGLAMAAIMVFAFALDGVDGWLARRFSQASRFGARLDQELDALFTLVLAATIFWMDKAGAWILLAGAWHYLFHGLRSVFPGFRNNLPFSHRRRIICGAVVASLIACASPFLQPPYAEFLGLAIIILLSASFLIDIVWLWRLFGLQSSHNIDAAPQQDAD